MIEAEVDALTDVLLETTSSLIGIAVRALQAGPLDTSVAQQRILNLLAVHGSLSVNAVAAELGVDQSNGSRHCTRLESMGAITRSRSRLDQRSVTVRLSPLGAEHVEASRAARRAMIRDVVIASGVAPNLSTSETLARFNAAALSRVETPSSRAERAVLQ